MQKFAPGKFHSGSSFPSGSPDHLGGTDAMKRRGVDSTDACGYRPKDKSDAGTSGSALTPSSTSTQPSPRRPSLTASGLETAIL
jgi:hypothetical protein